MFGGVLLFHPWWVVSSALAGLASGFGMGPGVSLPLWTAVTLFSLVSECPHRWCGGSVFWWWGVNRVRFWCGWVVARCLCAHILWVCVSFRPVSASSLHTLLCF